MRLASGHTLASLVSLAPLLFAVAAGGCNRSSKELPATLPAVTLPASDVEAGRALGKAAATEKDPAKLAATLVAFLDRLHVPVVSRKGDALLAKGPIASPQREPWFWEPVIVGVARATVAGDQRPLPQVFEAFVPKLDAKALKKLDFASLMRDLAAQASKQPVPVFGPIAAAISEDLQQRKLVGAQPTLDPVATVLLGLFLYAEKTVDPAGLAPAAPPKPAPMRPGGFPFANIPGMPSNIPGMPSNLPMMPPRTVHMMDPGGSQGGSTVCQLLQKVTSLTPGSTTGMTSALSGLSNLGTAAGMLPGLPEEISDFLGTVGSAVSAASNIASSVTDGVADMGITAFFDATGDVSPAKVKYGDGPAKYTVKATSANPLSKDELNSLVDCLEAAYPSGGAALDPLRKIPPKGGVSGDPVAWGKTDQYDPKHGKFTSDGSIPLISTTDANGEAHATFQVKPKKGDGKATRSKRFTIFAEVFPFPGGASQVNAASNELFNREVPIALEIEVPLSDWTLTVTWKLRVQPPGMPGYFEEDGQGKVSFKLDPTDLSFHASGAGTHTYSMPSQMMPGGFVTCSAPVGPQPVDVALDGKVTDFETMLAEMHLKVTTPASREAMTIKCTAMGKAHTKQANAITGSISKDTKLEDFTMTLDDGESQDVAIDKMGGPMHISGPANVSVAATDGSE